MQTRLDNEKKKLTNIKKQIRGIRKHGQSNSFNFYNNPKDKKNDSGKLINIPKNNISLHKNEPIFNVITDAGKDKHPFILKGHITIHDGEPVEINRFYKDLKKSFEKMVYKYDETLEVVFSGEMIKYCLIFNKVEGSNYGTGCDFQQKTIKFKSDLCHKDKVESRFNDCRQINEDSLEKIYQYKNW